MEMFLHLLFVILLQIRKKYDEFFQLKNNNFLKYIFSNKAIHSYIYGQRYVVAIKHRIRHKHSASHTF